MPASQESAPINKRNPAAVLFSMQQLWRGTQWQEDANAAGRDLLPVICRCPWQFRLMKDKENWLYGVMDSCIAEESGYLSPSRIDNCKHAEASISVWGSYSACVTLVSEMSTESWSFHCSAMQVKMCVKWYELFKSKYWNQLILKHQESHHCPQFWRCEMRKPCCCSARL